MGILITRKWKRTTVLHENHYLILTVLVELTPNVQSHQCIRRDRAVGITVDYDTKAHLLTSPIFHSRDNEASGVLDCPIVRGPCNAEIGFMPEADKLLLLRGKDIDPKREFWRQLMKWIEQRNIPWIG